MEKIFKVIPYISDKKETPALYSIGILLNIGKYQTTCPVTGKLTLDELENAVKKIGVDLQNMLNRIKENAGAGGSSFIDIRDDAAPEDIWAVLSSVSDNRQFTDAFNGLEEDIRRGLAGYILENCNIFSGKGAYFSSHYIHDTGVIE